MNIKYISNARIPTPRANGYAIMKMCEQMSVLVDDFQLVIPFKKNSEDKIDPFIFYNIKNKFKIKRIPSFDLLGKTFSFGRFLYWVDLLSFFFFIKIKEIVNKDDLIYTRDFMMPLIFSKKQKIFLELHDIPRLNFLFRFAIKRVDLFFVLNINIKKELIKLGVEDKLIYIYPSGVDLDNFDLQIDKVKARSLLNLPQDKNIILYSGQFYSWKGVEVLANTAKILKNYLFLFVGGVEPELSEFKKNYGYLENILIESFKDRSDVSLYLKSADILVIPQSKKEKISTLYSSPLKMFEYMASKRPIVVSDLPSIRETLTEKEAVFADPSDPVSFPNAIEKLLSDKDLVNEITKNAYNKVLQYSWNKRAKSILNIIKENV